MAILSFGSPKIKYNKELEFIKSTFVLNFKISKLEKEKLFLLNEIENLINFAQSIVLINQKIKQLENKQIDIFIEEQKLILLEFKHNPLRELIIIRNQIDKIKQSQELLSNELMKYPQELLSELDELAFQQANINEMEKEILKRPTRKLLRALNKEKKDLMSSIKDRYDINIIKNLAQNTVNEYELLENQIEEIDLVNKLHIVSIDNIKNIERKISRYAANFELIKNNNLKSFYKEQITNSIQELNIIKQFNNSLEGLQPMIPMNKPKNTN